MKIRNPKKNTNGFLAKTAASFLALSVTLSSLFGWMPAFAQTGPSASFSATPTTDGAIITGMVTGLKDTTGVTVNYGVTPVGLSSYTIVGFSDATHFEAQLNGLSGEIYYEIYDQTTGTVLGPISSFFTASTVITPPPGTGVTGTVSGTATGSMLIGTTGGTAGGTGGGTAGGTATGAGSVTAGGGTDNTGPAVAQAYFTPAGDSAKVTVMVTGMYSNSSVTVKYGTSKTALNGSAVAIQSIDKIPGVNGIPFTGTIYGLQPTTTYYYSVYAMDGSTDLTPTVDTDGKTKLPIPTFATIAGTATDTYNFGVIKSMTATNITQTKATIKGAVAHSTDTFQVLVDMKGDGTYNTPFTPTVQSDGTFTFDLTGLKAAHVYAYVATKPGDQTVLYSYRQAFMTPPVSVSSYLSVINDTSVTVAAKFTDGVQNPGILYSDKNGTFNTSPTSMSTGSDGTYTAQISGLTANTAYEYEIVGNDSGTQIQYTNPISFITAQSGSTTPPTVGHIADATGTSAQGVTGYNKGALVQCIGGIIQKSDTSVIDSNHLVGEQGCSFTDLIQLISRIIDFLLFLVAPIITTGVILYAGILILTSGGSSEKISQAKGMFFKAVIGLCIAMGAWIIVKFILVTLGYDSTVFAHFY